MRATAFSFILVCLAALAATPNLVAAQSTDASAILSQIAAASITVTATAVAPTSTGTSFSAFGTCCANYLNTLELCVYALTNPGNATFKQVDLQIYNCACAQGQSFYKDFASCYACYLPTSKLTIDNVTTFCNQLSSGNVSFPTLSDTDNYPISSFKAAVTPTGTLAVTTWSGKNSGEHVAVHVVSVFVVITASAVFMLLL